MKILVFGGTGEARDLANRLVALGHEVTTSLAGRTSAPVRPRGAVRIGGFGGPEGLAAYLGDHRPDFVIDATHPYARVMPGRIARVTQHAGIAALRLQRPEWTRPEGAVWQHSDGIADAIAGLPRGAVAFVTTGHEALGALASRRDCRFIVRLIEPASSPLPDHVHLILARPPFTLDGEIGVLRRHGVTHLLTKNSGGDQTRAKIDAAAALGIVTVMVRRPAAHWEREAHSIAEALSIVQDDASRS